jgi:hypothetical protein
MHAFDLRDILIPMFAIGLTFGMPLSAIVLYWAYHIRKITHETALKQAMVARGYSANEIVQVLTNGKGKFTNPAFDLPPAKSVKSFA